MKPGLIFLDLEGTLLEKEYRLDNGKVAPSAWTLLAEALGPDCFREEEATKDRWNSGGYASYVEWMRDTIRIHKKYGLKSHTFYEIMNSVKFMPGAKESLHKLRKCGMVTAIITGGFKALADRVQRAFKIDHALSGCEYFFNSKTEEIEHFNLLPSDEEGKADFMVSLGKEHGISPSNCVFVGDGKNDVHLARAVGFSIAFNAQEELKRVCNVSIDQLKGYEDFTEVARIICEREEG